MSRSFVRSAACSAMTILSTTAVTIASAPAIAASSRATRVQLRATTLGKILVTNSGFTLYAFTRDTRNRDSCIKLSTCTSVWPILKTTGKPIAGRGLKASLLGTITLAHGIKQVTYAGHALYGYSGDSAAGDTSYVGVSQFGGAWDAVSAAGKLVH